MSERLDLRSADGVRLSAILDRPERAGDAGRSFVLLLPGLWRRAESTRIRWLALEFARRWPVITLDFRGHGESQGAFTFGQREHLDVEAALAAARERGLDRVAVIGLSMGAAAIPATFGGGATQDTELASAVLVAAPSDFGAIRPRPWRGHRDVAWGDMLAMPRLDWRFPFTKKRRPQEFFANFPNAPVRFLHARGDWLVDHSLGEQLHAANPSRGDFYLIDTPGLHADELLGRRRELMMRLMRPFIDASLTPPVASVGGDAAGMSADAGPWRDAFLRHVLDVRAHAADLGGIPLTDEPAELQAFSAGRDGVHLVARVGDRIAWARGLRDGSVHGLNLLANALATDAVSWPQVVRDALTGAQARLLGSSVRRPATKYVVRPRGPAGFEVLDS